MAAAVNVLGEEFLVNTTVSGPQGAPTITTLANGNFLIAFGNGGQSSSAPGDTSSVLAQILTPTGQKVGGELWIDQSIIGSQYQPHISPLSAGGFVATWHDVRAVDDENFSWSFRSRVFDAIGRQTGPDIVLENAQDGGHVASLANGNFVLSWSDMAGGGHAQLFSSSGTPLGPRSDLVGDLNWGVDVTALADGGFVTSTMRVSNGGWIIEGQKFNPAGQAVGSSFIIRNAGEHDVLGHATAATSNGGFVTVWAEFDHGRQDIKLQLFDANSAAVGTPIIANLTDETYNEEPEVAVLDDGTVLVTWQRFSYYYDIRGNQINNGSGLTAQRFSENGVKIGSEIWIDDTKVTKYTTSAVTAAAHGGYAITWTDSSGTLGDSGSDGAVKARIYGPNSIPQITSGNGELASYQVRENVNAVARVTADDADANAKLAFKITGGSDASFFTIDPTTGALAFKALPNLADPTHNAFYDLTVQVSDGYAADQQAIKVQVIPATAGGIQWTGTAGGDTMGGTEFDDLLDGAGGDDLLYGGRGNDHLLGGEGNDKLSGGGELDVLNGGSGDDTFLVRSTLETIVEAIGQGNDTIETDLSGYVLPDNVEDLLYTGVAAFNGTGNSLRNALAGGRGSDRLDGLAGADIMKGGDGNDTYVVDHAVDIVFEIAGQGTDRVLAKVSHTLSANVENLTLTSGASINGTGNAQSNIILGNGGVNFLNGRGGADSLTGGASNDTFIFQRGEADSDIVTDFTGAATAGGDLLNFTGYGAGAYLTHVANSDLYEIHAGTAYGGATETIRLLGVTNLGGGDYLIDGLAGGELGVDHSGDDIYFVISPNDAVTENPGGGYDTVQTTLTSYILGENVEALVYTGSKAFSGTGNALNNLLVGSAGSDRLDGGGGTDTLKGGSGSDTYIVDNLGDVVIEGAHDGLDRVLAQVSYMLTDNVENLTLSTSKAINGSGNALTNVIVGNGGINIIDGRGGADRLTGGAGNDIFIFQRGEASGDTVSDFAGAGTVGGDLLKFVGYGTNAYLTHQAGSDVYLVHAAETFDGVIDTIQLVGVTNLAAGDYIFA